MAMAAESYPAAQEEMDALADPAVAVLEEIEEDEESLRYGKPKSLPTTPEAQQPVPVLETLPLTPESPQKTSRDFGNISPISELLDDNDLDVDPCDDEEKVEGCEQVAQESGDSTTGKVTPEPGPYPNRVSFPRISDGRTSPILAYSPSLLQSPSSSSNGKSRIQSSPSAAGSGGVGKRPRNITRMLDNISDHSSGEDDVNSVGMMMAKFTV